MPKRVGPRTSAHLRPGRKQIIDQGKQTFYRPSLSDGILGFLGVCNFAASGYFAGSSRITNRGASNWARLAPETRWKYAITVFWRGKVADPALKDYNVLDGRQCGELGGRCGTYGYKHGAPIGAFRTAAANPSKSCFNTFDDAFDLLQIAVNTGGYPAASDTPPHDVFVNRTDLTKMFINAGPIVRVGFHQALPGRCSCYQAMNLAVFGPSAKRKLGPLGSHDAGLAA